MCSALNSIICRVKHCLICISFYKTYTRCLVFCSFSPNFPLYITQSSKWWFCMFSVVKHQPLLWLLLEIAVFCLGILAKYPFFQIPNYCKPGWAQSRNNRRVLRGEERQDPCAVIFSIIPELANRSGNCHLISYETSPCEPLKMLFRKKASKRLFRTRSVLPIWSSVH